EQLRHLLPLAERLILDERAVEPFSRVVAGAAAIEGIREFFGDRRSALRGYGVETQRRAIVAGGICVRDDTGRVVASHFVVLDRALGMAGGCPVICELCGMPASGFLRL